MLDQLVADGLAAYRDGKLSGFSLTKPGREEHARLLAARARRAGRARRRRRRPTGSSSRSTPSCSTVCTEWQLRDVDGESTVNDHSDAAYDAGVIEKLADLHAEVEPICTDLGARPRALRRLRPAPRATPSQRVRAGDTDWFTKPMIASYHTVWFELHEDLLCTLGIERGAEGEG